MAYLEIVLKLVIGLSILNVWLLRYGKASKWRGGVAQNMKEEFAAYGLPIWFMKVIGALKIILAVALMASIWFGQLERISAMGIAALMFSAIFMHLRIGDPLQKSLPAAIFLILSVLILWL